MSDDIGQLIRVERERRGWSQEFLAAKVGATQSTIDRIENGLTRKSRVLPEIITALDLEVAGHEKRQTYVAPVGGFARVNYVLPRELIDRIEKYKTALGVSSDDEVVRRIIDDFLKKRDEVDDIISRIISKYKLIRSVREASGIILANHPLVEKISFERDCVEFVFNSPLYGVLSVNIASYGSVKITKENGDLFLFHDSDAPSWVSAKNKTDKYADADYISF